MFILALDGDGEMSFTSPVEECQELLDKGSVNLGGLGRAGKLLNVNASINVRCGARRLNSSTSDCWGECADSAEVGSPHSSIATFQISRSF